MTTNKEELDILDNSVRVFGDTGAYLCIELSDAVKIRTALTKEAAQPEGVEEAYDAIETATNSLAMMSYTAAGKDHDLSQFLAVNAGILKKSLNTLRAAQQNMGEE